MKLDDIFPFPCDLYTKNVPPPASSPGHLCGATGDFWRRRLPQLQQPIPHRRPGRLLRIGLMKETRAVSGEGVWTKLDKISDTSAINTIDHDHGVRMIFDK